MTYKWLHFEIGVLMKLAGLLESMLVKVDIGVTFYRRRWILIWCDFEECHTNQLWEFLELFSKLVTYCFFNFLQIVFCCVIHVGHFWDLDFLLSLCFYLIIIHMFELIKKLKSNDMIINFIYIWNKWIVDINVGLF